MQIVRGSLTAALVERVLVRGEVGPNAGAESRRA